MFLSPLDICNRALQHLGVTRIDPALGFTENSKQAAECAFTYDKVRRAELRRNVWRFATRRAIIRARETTSLFIAPSLWDSTITYLPNALVSDQNGTIWISTTYDNLANTPGAAPGPWQIYFGPLMVSKYDATDSYWSGELVYKYPGDGTYTIYLSQADDNDTDPATAVDWVSTTTYNKDMIVNYLGTTYLSLIMLNEGNIPSASAANWDIGTTYAASDTVNGSDGYTYTSIAGSNVGNDPTATTGYWTQGGLTPWTSNYSGGSGSFLSTLVSASLSASQPSYPLTTGPVTSEASRNAFYLPANFLREAPQDPKLGAVTYLGGPGAKSYTDWAYEGNWIISRESKPIMLRFVADVADVSSFDDMFCEGLALRMAMQLCETMTQSAGKFQNLAAEYRGMMSEARLVNGIETGSYEPPEDSWLEVRL